MKKTVYQLVVIGLVTGSSINAYASGIPAEGKKVFEAHCIQCHGLHGDANTKIAGKLNKPPASFTDPNYKDSRGKKLSTYTDEELESKVKYGSKGTAMPSWKAKLSDDEISDVVAYVRSLSE